MDLQTRKLNVITFLARLQDEIFFEKIENYILKKQVDFKNEINFRPFTVDELIHRVQKSEQDLKAGNFKTQEELEKMSVNW
ncbi:MAG: hypothetical protein LBE36_07760 [Flavobacteriaceae bacterium]|jgi:beta-xylosidase|nr:hypothetical protein [Flavobacteriaceae bacterium]